MADPLLTSPGRRARRAYWISIRVMSSYLGLYLRGKLLGQRYYQRRLLALHERNAKRVKAGILELQGLFIKVGQLLSIMANFLPEAFEEPLTSLQDQVPPRPVEEVRQRIQEELGRDPEEAFGHFEDMPLASASIGQVHRATLPDGTEVVVKVQHRNIEAIAAVDLEVVNRLQKIVSWWFGVKGMDYLYSQIREMIEAELNFSREAEAMVRIGGNLTAIPAIKVPAVHPAFSAERVLTTTWCPGVKITNLAQLDAWRIDRPALLQTLLQAYCQMVFLDGDYHADPHPGNLLVQEDGTLVLLDFGAVATLQEQTREGLAELIEAAVRNDTDAMISACRQLGFIAPGAEAERLATRMIDALRHFLQQDVKIEGLNFREIEINPFQNSLFDLIREIGISGVTSTVQVPKEWVLLNRMVTLLLGICQSLAPEVNPLDTVRPYLRDFVLGDKGSLVSFVRKLLQAAAVNVLALPGEMRTFMQRARQGKLSVAQPDLLRAASLAYHGQRMQLFGGLLVAALAGTAWAYVDHLTIGWQIGLGLAVLCAWLSWRAARAAKRLRKQWEMS
ncbi:MAG: AarF/ABC1/UbiB kinase family protein [Lewinella sp.]|nr:AarF/ABC1/UbiB kinase family protein [Lewinella sp.]